MSTLKVDTVRPVTTDGSLSLKGDSGGSATTNGISVDSSGNTSITGTTTVSQLDADNIRLDGNTISSTDTNGAITLDPNGTGTISLDGAVTINESGADVDFRVESDTNTHALFVEGNSGNVGIGTNTPAVRVSGTCLSLNDTTQSSIELLNGGASSGEFISAASGTFLSEFRSLPLEFRTGNTQRMTIDASGNIGAPSGTNIYNASDERLKQNITDLSGCLQKVLSMRGVSFNWIDGFCDSEADKTLYGLIAQELQIVDSNLVDSFSNNTVNAGDVTVENPLRVNEKFIIPMLVESIKEQQALIESQQAQIDALSARLDALENPTA